jgi:hypothetical protein
MLHKHTKDLRKILVILTDCIHLWEVYEITMFFELDIFFIFFLLRQITVALLLVIVLLSLCFIKAL